MTIKKHNLHIQTDTEIVQAHYNLLIYGFEKIDSLLYTPHAVKIKQIAVINNTGTKFLISNPPEQTFI